MQEHDNDRLEQFFRKAAARPDVSFNEDDWKKLEARLDAAGVGSATSGNKIRNTATTILGVMILISSAVWMSGRHENDKSLADRNSSGIEVPEPALPAEHAAPAADETDELAEAIESNEDIVHRETQSAERQAAVETNILKKETSDVNPAEQGANRSQQVVHPVEPTVATPAEAITTKISSDAIVENANDAGLQPNVAPHDQQEQGLAQTTPLPGERIDNGLAKPLPASDNRYKQKAVVELPGAEEEKTREADATIEEEQASDQMKHVATPRLSLLLFYAPDFSGTSLGEYSAPGRAFGALLHYHFRNRWSISGGVIKTQKQYTGNGEDYTPPTGYWKNNTNGIIPQTIDGSCSILEFPLMVQYTLHNSGKNRWLLGAGVSSYLMKSESYVYYFDQPNPGAKDRWDSRGSSRFLFNMVNFSLGYERQVMPGLMLGLEPYVKIPVEEIGWTNLKLFSTGASITLRYTILRKNNLAIPARSRPPD